MESHLSRVSVLLVGKEAEQLRDALSDVSDFEFVCCTDWQEFKAGRERFAPSIVVGDSQPYDPETELPWIVMKAAFAWDAGRFSHDPPGWDFTRLALLDRLRRESAGERPFRVMAVDDESGIRTAVKAILLRFGLDVVAESERERSLETLRNEDFDLLLSDVNMPGMSWDEYVGLANEIAPATDIYLSTGDRGVSLIPGVKGILNKPFGLADIAVLLRPYLRAHS